MIQPNLPLTDTMAPTAGGPHSTVLARLQHSDLFREYQRAFETTTGLPLVLREAGSFRTPLQGSSRVNPFCVLMTQTNKTCAACLQLQQRLEDEASCAPKTLECYAGLSESVVPVRVGSVVIGYLQTGQIFLRAPSKKKFQTVIRALQRETAGELPHAWESVYFQTRTVPRQQYDATIRLLAIFAGHLSIVSNQLMLRATVAEPDVIVRGRRFIVAHHAEQLGLDDVARAVSMSANYFCRIFKKVTGLSFSEYLARTRIESAKQNLLNPLVRVSEAAFAAGFQSLSQFNRVFHRIVGETPSSFRSRIHRLPGKIARSGTHVSAA